MPEVSDYACIYWDEHGEGRTGQSYIHMEEWSTGGRPPGPGSAADATPT